MYMHIHIRPVEIYVRRDILGYSMYETIYTKKCCVQGSMYDIVDPNIRVYLN